ncbi:small ribosomal subunit protein uS2m isoform X2 [Panulirus ornatus]|uniref:small ribosomal subunit protein uS2m isoform X2 n=1 Tax=Panulirus ornatus TaxID=150431 RepID=UPI003A8B0F5C
MATLCRRIFHQLSVGLPRGLQARNIVTSYSPVLTSTQPSEKLPESSPDNDIIAERMKNALKYPDFFKVAELYTVEDLFNARVHLGHRIGSIDSRMNQFIFGSRLGHLIIDLDQTAVLLREALNFTAHIAFRGGIILFVGRSPQHQFMIETTAKECGEYSHVRFWEEGTFTNSLVAFGCVTRLPDLLIFLHTMDNVISQHKAIKEAAKMLIPTVGIVDTNCNPNLITYPVPGNDDSVSSVNLFCNLFKTAIVRGKEKRKELLALQ